MAKPKQPRKRKKGASAMFVLGMRTPTVDEASSIKNRTQRELAFMHRAYCAGMIAAIYEALLLCERSRLPDQPWMNRAMQRVLEALARGELAYGPGPSGNPFTRERYLWKHFVRYEAVLEIRERQRQYPEIVRSVSEASNLSPKDRKQFLKNWPDPGKTLDDAYDRAPDLLRGTSAFGSAATFRRSYLMIKRYRKDPDKAANLKVLSYHTMDLFGLNPEEKRSRG